MKLKLNIRPTNIVFETFKNFVKTELSTFDAFVIVDNGVMFLNYTGDKAQVESLVNSYLPVLRSL